MTESDTTGSKSSSRCHFQMAVVAFTCKVPWPYSAAWKADQLGCGVTQSLYNPSLPWNKTQYTQEKVEEDIETCRDEGLTDTNTCSVPCYNTATCLLPPSPMVM